MSNPYIYVYDNEGDEAFFDSSCSLGETSCGFNRIPETEQKHSGGVAAASFVDLQSPSTRTFHYGLCRSTLGAAPFQVQGTLTDPNGEQRPFAVELSDAHPTAVLGASPPGPTGLEFLDTQCTPAFDPLLLGPTTSPDSDHDGIPDASDQCPTVAGPAPSGCPNRAPKAVKDFGRSTGSPTTGNVLKNDSDPDGDPLRLVHYTQGRVGKVICTSTGICTYTPERHYAGHDSFSYTISDNRGGTASARVFIRAKSLPPADGKFTLEMVDECGSLGGYVSSPVTSSFDSQDRHTFYYTWKLGALAGDTPILNFLGIYVDVNTVRCNNADIVNVHYGYNPISLDSTLPNPEWGAGVEFQLRYAGTKQWIKCSGCFRKFTLGRDSLDHEYGMPGDSKDACPACAIPSSGLGLTYSASRKQPIAEVRYIVAAGYKEGYSIFKKRIATLGHGFKDER